MRKYFVTVIFKNSNRIYYPSVDAKSHINAVTKVKKDRIKKRDAHNVLSIKSQIIKDFNKQ